MRLHLFQLLSHSLTKEIICFFEVPRGFGLMGFGFVSILISISSFYFLFFAAYGALKKSWSLFGQWTTK